VTSTPISELVPRQRAELTGTIEAVVTHERPAVSFDVAVNDGTGSITLRFLGRRAIPGFASGRSLGVEGTPAEISGGLVMLNPLYAFDPKDGQP